MIDGSGDALIEARGISKLFDGVPILSNVSFRLRPGEVCGLLGENGAGKSVLIRVLSGLLSIDGGVLAIDGAPVTLTPRKAQALGIQSVLHENNLIRDMTVSDNLLLRREIKVKGLPFIKNRETKKQSQRLLRSFSCNIDLSRTAGELTATESKMLEICKAFAFGPRLVILDEPCVSLDDADAQLLFRYIREAREQGVSVVYASHNLKEVLGIADRVVVMNRGEITEDIPVSEVVDTDRIVQSMVDKNSENRYPRIRTPRGGVLLEVDGATAASGRFRDVSFSVHRGEIVGVVGLLNEEKSDLAKMLFGLEPLASGQILAAGGRRAVATPTQALRAGIAYVGDDPESSVFRNLSITDNVNILSGRLPGRKYKWGPFLRLEQLEFVSRYVIRQFKMRLLGRQRNPSELSRGMLQKLLIARWSLIDSSLYIMNDPTKQLDIPSKLDLYNLMNTLVRDGKAILLISSDINEMAGMCDRVLIMNGGKIDTVVDDESITPARLLKYVCG